MAIAAVVVLAAAPGLWRLRLRTDGGALVPEHAPEVIRDRAIRAQFGVEPQFVVVVRTSHPDGIFNPATIALIRELTDSFSRIPGVDSGRIISLATESSFRFRPGTFVTRRLLEPALTNKIELNQLRDDLSRIKLYTGTLVSRDGASSVVLLPAPPAAVRAKVHARILQIIGSKASFQDQIAVVGAPVAELLLGKQVFEDLGVPRTLLSGYFGPTAGAQLPNPPRLGMVPLSLLAMVFVFFLCFRSVLAAILPLAGAGTTLVVALGTMGWCGVPLYLTTAIMPVLLTVISVTNDIYLCSRFLRLLREEPDETCTTLLGRTFLSLAGPTACAALTALAGFLSFAFSPLVPVRVFGIFTGLGVLVGLLFSLTVVPALLALAPRGWLAGRGTGFAGLEAWFGRLAETVARHPWWVAGLALLTLSVTPLGLRRLVVQDSWTSGFDPRSEFLQITRQVNEGFFGTHQLFISLEAKRNLSGDVTRTEALSGLLTLPGNLVDDPAEIEGSPIKFSIATPSEQMPSAPVGPSEWHSQILNAARRPEGIFARCSRPDGPPGVEDTLRGSATVRFEIADQTQLRPDVIGATARLGEFIRLKHEYQVGGVLSAADYLETSRFMLRNSEPEGRRLPENATEARLLWKDYGIMLGAQRLRQVVDDNYTSSLATVFLKNANFADTARLMQTVRAYEQEHLRPMGIKLEFGGDVAVSQSLIAGIVTTQMQSLLWSLAAIFAVTAIMGGSAKWGLFCLAPSLLAVVLKLAAMGWAGIPLGVATSMFAAMTLGIGVNCAIQLLEGYSAAQAGQSLRMLRRQVRAPLAPAPLLALAGTHEMPRALAALPQSAPGNPPASETPLTRAMALCGPPALFNTLAVSLGFGVLALSPVPANARLGLLLVLGLVNCFLVSLVLLPVLLHWWPIRAQCTCPASGNPLSDN
jgi:predicted RND superfamily exporter protein